MDGWERQINRRHCCMLIRGLILSVCLRLQRIVTYVSGYSTEDLSVIITQG